MNARKARNQSAQTKAVASNVLQKKTNNTGLPDNLKSGIENLSGHSMDDVKVHYNSGRPAQLQAHAFAQGNQIHLAPGQEKHLPHEAWHVVQQKEGRVKPTMQLKASVPVNDDPGLEREADVMGAKAISGEVNQRVVKKVAGNLKKVAQLGRKEDEEQESGTAKYVLKVVLPGSGDDHWRTHRDTGSGQRLDNPQNEDTPTMHGLSDPGKRFTLTVSGPGAPLTKGAAQHVGGISDTGSNSIEQNKHFIPGFILSSIEKYEIENGERAKPILILIKAHSRNAVAGTQIANIVRKETRHKPNIKIELVAFDPVPGPLHRGTDRVVDVSTIPSSTVVYSVATQYLAGFSPQMVLGAKRIIISRQNHSAGLSVGFRYNDQVYKGSRINSLPTGVFIDSNNNGSNKLNLLKIDSIEDALHNLEYEFQASGSQSRDVGRLHTITAVLQHYFFHHGPPPIVRHSSKPYIPGLGYKKSKND